MARSKLSSSRVALLANAAATGAKGSDLILNEVDTGMSKNGVLVLVLDNPASSDQANIQVWTSVISNFISSGTQVTANSDTALVAINSDVAEVDLAYTQDVLGGTISDIAISSNKITSLTQDGMYVFFCPDVKRYLNVQYDSDGTGGKFTGIFIGDTQEEAPYSAAVTAY